MWVAHKFTISRRGAKEASRQKAGKQGAAQQSSPGLASKRPEFHLVTVPCTAYASATFWLFSLSP